jgi:hypothetical protein
MTTLAGASPNSWREGRDGVEKGEGDSRETITAHHVWEFALQRVPYLAHFKCAHFQCDNRAHFQCDKDAHFQCDKHAHFKLGMYAGINATVTIRIDAQDVRRAEYVRRGGTRGELNWGSLLP